MRSKLIATALVALTVTTVAYYPAINAKTFTPDPVPVNQHLTTSPIVDVVFVLDTTGSMSGLIETAKEKIWSIATTMTSAQQAPELRIGLVAFRDRGDQYVTRVVDLSDDLDSVYAALMDFQAGGGGDGPESVNKALYDAVHAVSWSQESNAFRAIFLVGDAPPHMDYQDEVQYPEILASAAGKGIVVNTIQCGEVALTASPWQRIASLGNGRFFQVEQAGSAVAMTTPYDDEIAELSAKLDDTRLYFGSKTEKAKMQSKIEATEKLNRHASVTARARRGAFNASASGKKNLLGENELVEAVTSGDVNLDDLDKEALPESLQSLGRDEQLQAIRKTAGERKNLERQISELAEQRRSYQNVRVDELGGAKDSLDHKLYDAVREQAAKAGLEYRDGPAY